MWNDQGRLEIDFDTARRGELRERLEPHLEQQLLDRPRRANKCDLWAFVWGTSDLLARVAFMSGWLKGGPPNSFWISAFFFPQGFMTTALQAHARRYQLPIDMLLFRAAVLPYADLAAVPAPPDNGVYIHGIFMEGARFDAAAGVMAESRPAELFAPMNCLHLQPADLNDAPPPGPPAAPTINFSPPPAGGPAPQRQGPELYDPGCSGDGENCIDFFTSQSLTVSAGPLHLVLAHLLGELLLVVADRAVKFADALVRLALPPSLDKGYRQRAADPGGQQRQPESGASAAVASRPDTAEKSNSTNFVGLGGPPGDALTEPVLLPIPAPGCESSDAQEEPTLLLCLPRVGCSSGGSSWPALRTGGAAIRLRSIASALILSLSGGEPSSE